VLIHLALFKQAGVQELVEHLCDFGLSQSFEATEVGRSMEPQALKLLTLRTHQDLRRQKLADAAVRPRYGLQHRDADRADGG
jgi:hypothetical protein